jgi:predicted ATP-grasp superfamily ATP-dependent carboligase
VSDPRTDPDGFLRDIARVVEREGIDVVIPMTDVSAPLVLALRSSHPEVEVPFPDLEDYRAISDKEGLLRVAGEVGVPVPRQVVLERPTTAMERDPASVGFPLVLKPARSAVSTGAGIGKFGVTQVADAAQLEAALRAYPEEAYPILVQERIMGPGLGVFLLAWEGRTLAAFAHRRIREKPPTGGVSVYRESVAVAPELREYSERLLARYRWRGVAMVEFKQDARTGTPYLMEVNGRFWGSLQLAIDSGVDFPAMLMRALFGEPDSPVDSFRMGIRSRWLWGDVDHLLWILKTPGRIRASHPDLPGPLGALGRFLVPWRPGDRFEVLRARDPGPFVRETANWFRDIVERPGAGRRDSSRGGAEVGNDG